MKHQYLAAYNIVSKLVKHGYIAYFVGGYVRDMIMKKKSDDIDIATNAPIGTIQSIFSKTISVGEQFGITIVVEDEYNFEVATFRKEEGHHDGRRPSIIYSASPQEDALRRDFTINGIFFDPINSIYHDFVEGVGDIKKGIIKAIGNADKRFQEDKLRMLRAIRYSTRFNFTIDDHTKEAIIKYSSSLFPSVAMERIHQEFEKMSAFGNLSDGLEMLYDLKLLQIIFPKTAAFSKFTLISHLKILKKLPNNTPLILSLIYLLNLSSLEEMLSLCVSFKFSNNDKKLVKTYHKIINLSFAEDDYRWSRIYAHDNSDLIINILTIEKEDDALFQAHMQRKNSLSKAILRAKKNHTLLSAEHLIKAGITPGKQLGLLIEKGEQIAVNEKIEDVQKILLRLNLHHN